MMQRLSAIALLLVLSACGTNQSPFAPTAVEATRPLSRRELGSVATLVGAGDIGFCGLEGAALTASLLDQIPGMVFTLGDNAHPNGSSRDFAECYDPWWGRHKSRTRPTPGNHEYHTPGAAGYFAYFGANAGPTDLPLERYGSAGILTVH